MQLAGQAWELIVKEGHKEGSTTHCQGIAHFVKFGKCFAFRTVLLVSAAASTSVLDLSLLERAKPDVSLLFLSADLKIPQGSPAYHARSPSWTGPLSAVPEISCMELTAEDEFFVLACDGKHPAFCLKPLGPSFILMHMVVHVDINMTGHALLHTVHFEAL